MQQGTPDRRPWILLIVFTIVAAVTITTAAVVFGRTIDGTPMAAGANGAAAQAGSKWRHGAADMPSYDEGVAAWTADDLFVVLNDEHVSAYAQADGALRWRIKPPEGVFCGAGTAVVQNRVAVAYGGGCAVAALLDFGMGSFVWQQPFKTPQYDDKPAKSASLEIIEDTVVVTQSFGMAGLEEATGRTKWSKPTPPDTPEKGLHCRAKDAMPQGRAVALLVTCLNSYPEFDLAIVAVDVAGAVTKEKTLVKPIPTTTIVPAWVSTTPPVIFLDDADDESAYLMLDDTFTPTARVEAGNYETGLARPQMDFNGDDASGSLHSRMRALVTDGLLVTVTGVAPALPSSIVAFDLKNGEKKWETPAAEGDRFMAPVAVDNGEIIAEVAPPDDDEGPQQVVRVKPADGALTVVGTYQMDDDPKTKGISLIAFYEFFWAGGVMFAAKGDYNQYAGALVCRFG